MKDQLVRTRSRGQLLRRAAVAAVGIVLLAGATLPAKDQFNYENFFADYARPQTIPSPDDNPTTPEKVRLGKQLFFDPRLSGSGAISCASCHNPGLGWQDGLALGIGHKGSVLPKHTPTLLDLAWGGPMFWDGRADTLEAQALGPLMAEKEMGGTENGVKQTVNAIAAYRDGLRAAYPDSESPVASVAKAIAAYERTIVSGTAPFDRWIGGQPDAISGSAKRGFRLFNTTAKCSSCHSGWRFTDDGFHDIGLPGADLGRGAILKGITPLEHAFKTPTLRNIALRPPYMHDGSLRTLGEVIDHYDHGFVQRPSLADKVVPLHLTPQDKADLEAFLRTLTSEDEPVTVPVLPQ